MDNNQTPPKDSAAKDGPIRIAGMPTIAELRRRVLVRQLEKKKKETGKKSARARS